MRCAHQNGNILMQKSQNKFLYIRTEKYLHEARWLYKVRSIRWKLKPLSFKNVNSSNSVCSSLSYLNFALLSKFFSGCMVRCLCSSCNVKIVPWSRESIWYSVSNCVKVQWKLVKSVQRWSCFLQEGMSMVQMLFWKCGGLVLCKIGDE